MKFNYLKHTADAKFKAFGRNIDDVFVNSALAMFNILGETNKVKDKKSIKINVKGHDFESLMYNFLEELLFYLDTKKFFLHRIKEIKVDKVKFTLVCKAYGDNIKNYDVKSQIKAITYNDMSIRKTNKGYEATVVVDI